jgi:hypothetical protein
MDDSYYKIQFERTFLLEKLPEDFDRAAEHFQFFDNYIENTRLCLRTVRAPKTNQYTYFLEQRIPRSADDLGAWSVSRIYLSESEHEAFAQFEGREVKTNERVETNEIRFNRYFYDSGGKRLEINIHLGKEIWGLILARVYFESAEELQAYQIPEIAVLEVTQNEFFVGENLIGKTFADVQAQFAAARRR